MVELELFDYYNGTLSIIQVTINLIIGFTMIYKYYEYKNKTLLYMGLTMILLTSVWFTHSLAFILVLTTGVGLSPEIFFIMAFPITAVTTILWMVVITGLIFKENQKKILTMYIIYAIIFELLFFFLLFQDTERYIGVLENPIEPDIKPFIQLHLLIILINSLVTGILFFRESKKSPDPEIKLKGTLFLVGITLFVIGSIIDSFSVSITMLLIVRVMLMVGAFFTYGAFLLPEWMKKLLLKEK